MVSAATLCLASTPTASPRGTRKRRMVATMPPAMAANSGFFIHRITTMTKKTMPRHKISITSTFIRCIFSPGPAQPAQARG